MLRFKLIWLLVMLLPIMQYNGEQRSEGIIIFKLAFSRNLFQEVNPEDANAAVKVYADVIKRKAQIKIKREIELIATIYDSVDELRTALSKNEIDILGITSKEYLALRDQFGLLGGLTGTDSGSKFQKYVLLVHKDLPAQKFSELRGKRLAIPSLSSHPLLEVWLTNTLSKNNLPNKEKFFSEVKNEDREAKALYNVFFRSSDCAIVRKSVFETLSLMNPQIAKSMRILDSSPEIITTCTIPTKVADPELIKIILDICATLHTTVEGKNLLSIFKLMRIMPFSEEDLAATKAMIDEFNKAKKISGKRK